MYTLKGVDVKNTVNEFTISEFQQIINILSNKEKNNLDKYLDITVIAGLKDESILCSLTFDELKSYLNTFNINEINTDLTKSIEVNGRTYVCYDKEFILKAKDSALIENSMKNKDWILTTAAILFKDESLTFREHYDNNHINHKKVLFKDVSAGVIAPYIFEISENYINKIEYIQNQQKINNIIDEYMG
jgi:hypothetical protein